MKREVVIVVVVMVRESMRHEGAELRVCGGEAAGAARDGQGLGGDGEGGWGLAWRKAVEGGE